MYIYQFLIYTSDFSCYATDFFSAHAHISMLYWYKYIYIYMYLHVYLLSCIFTFTDIHIYTYKNILLILSYRICALRPYPGRSLPTHFLLYVRVFGCCKRGSTKLVIRPCDLRLVPAGGKPPVESTQVRTVTFSMIA